MKPSTMLARQRREVVGLGGKVDRIEEHLVAADGGEPQVRAAGVQSHHDPRIGVELHGAVFSLEA